ncbi:MAG: hypothetical protein D6785_05375 [Planctomycetota bacterium]|nr:MAG: hypothetical protein D6785_05375 [Planctomycetota bacterium]
MNTIYELYQTGIETFGEKSFSALDYNAIIFEVKGYLFRIESKEIYQIEKLKEVAKKVGKAPAELVKTADKFLDIMAHKSEKLSEKMAEKLSRADIEDFEKNPKSKKWVFWLVKNAMEWLGIPSAIISIVSAMGLPLFVFLLVKGALWIPFIKKILGAAKKKLEARKKFL